MTMIKRILAGMVGLTLGLVLLFSSGCAGRSISARFYVLSPMASDGEEMKNISSVSQDIAITIFPVSLPKYLKKSQIVTRTGSNELYLAEYDRWAGKIEEDIGRVVAENLSIILHTDRVFSSAAMEPLASDYTVKMEVIRFEGRLGGNLELFVRWTISDSRENVVYGVEGTQIIEPTGGATYADLVAAQSRALAAFSHELAGVIKKLAAS